jgi:hypothetical protein
MTDEPARGEGVRPDRVPARPAAPTRTSWSALALAALVGAVVGGAGVFVMRPPVQVVEPPATPPTAAPELTPAPVPAAPAPAPVPAPVARSRSRGRADWIFFLKPGDRLTRMGDAAALGMVIRTEKLHTFPDGTTGPAYLLQIPDGGQLFVDADELERGARIE